MTTKPLKFTPVTGEAALATLGYTRRGAGWVKKNPASTSQEAMK